MSDSPLFPADYRQARADFLHAAAAADLSTISRVHPREMGRDGKPLFIDTACMGARRSQAALMLLSGVHGVEGAFGSAVLTAILRQGWLKGFLGRAVLVHALNPYGFSFDCRTDENNVDLNRNFVDHADPPANPEYDRLAAVVTADSEAALGALVAEHGLAALTAVLARGQYRHPNGLCFGGKAPAWSAEMLFDILREELNGVRRLVVLDLHTGLGGFGQDQLICDAPSQSPDFARARAIWPACVSSIDGQAVSPPAMGQIGAGLARAVEEVTYVTLEIGTLPILEVFAALRRDLWLHARGLRAAPEAEPIAARMRAAFVSDDSAWQSASLAAAREAVASAEQLRL